ncbi:DUF2185 domain-containing protein [Pedobacter sp. ASV12]|uniref:DUF2185 domain-containing protein n=1 Tax=Pedobacter sp. ASV12 TaxID=2795120 RepID=UPI0018ED6626|nr:DUF2185 domain-containing protein [Pedobacter sp. ASV12]
MDNNFENFPPIGGLLVSKMIFDENRKPLFMYRNKSTRPEDSGWKIFSGFESEAYTDDPRNIIICNPSTLLKIDPTVAPLLLKGVGSVYERENEHSDWYRVSDYPLSDDFMVKHKLTENWTIDINNLFERRVEDNGSLLYTTGDKSVRLSIWLEEGQSQAQLKTHFEQTGLNRDQSQAKTIQTFDFSDEHVARVGYQIKEAEADKTYDVIYTFNLIAGEVLAAVFYFDEPADLAWAIETWKNLKLKDEA